MSLWLTGQEASEAASYVIDALLDEGSKVLYDHYLADREAAYATSRVLGNLQQLISLVYLPGDGEPGPDFGGEASHDPFDAGSASRAPGAAVRDTGMWSCEDEFVPCEIDSWARGQVPTKKRPQPLVDTADPVVVATNGKTTPKPRLRGKPSRNSQASAPVSSPTHHPGMPNPLEVTHSPRVTDVVPDQNPNSVDQVTRVRVLADMRRREAEGADKKRREEDRLKAEAEAAEKVKRDMKGKKFTLDEFGNAIQVRRVVANKLPPAFQDVDVGLPPSAQEPVLSPTKSALSKTSGTTRPRGVRMDSTVNAIDQSSTVPSGLDEHFQKSMTLQPPLTETIRLTSGVTLKEGEAVISGPAPPADSTHMSRRDFSAHQSTLSSGAPLDTGVDPLGSSIATFPSVLMADTAASVDIVPGSDGSVWGTGERASSAEVTDPTAPVSPIAGRGKKPSSAQRRKALGDKARNPRDRPFVSTTQTQSRTSSRVEWSQEASPARPASSEPFFGPGSESFDSSRPGVVFPPIDASKIKPQAKPKAEWGETAMRKQAGTMQVTQLAKELLLQQEPV